ncbi:hypothetical protein [Marinobacterium aestuariivivens]|uniref:DNA-binding protein n=1 Tax=Marinobacterium aestuariivivens TaxID=1698799 RepID=A0ABW2A978_9GAMM
MKDFRKERIGVANAARLLGVSVNELKDAIRNEGRLRGVIMPKPIICGAGAGHYQFYAGDIMDCAAQLKMKTPRAMPN